MRNQKGFTLIELLAVIAILAIIAIITTPTILNVINDSRKSAAEDKAWGTIDAAKLAYTQAQNITSVALPYTFNFADADTLTPTTGVTLTVSGDKPTAGKVTMQADGNITCNSLTFSDGYACTSNTTGTKMCCAKVDDTNKFVSHNAGTCTAVKTEPEATQSA